MTVVNPKSISGITSITTASGSDNLLTIHTSDASNTERFRIDSTGATKIVTGIVTTLTATTGIVTTLTANTVTSLGAISGTTGTFSGVIKIPDGSTSAPSIAASSDTNSGLYFAGADALGLVVGGSRKLLANSSGVTINNGDLTIDDKIIHQADTNTALRFPAADTITAETGGSERLRITSDGQLGLNNTSPDSWNTQYTSLQIHDAAVFYGSQDDSFVGLGANHYLNSGGNFIYSNSDFASRFYQVNGGFHFESASSGSAGGAITFTEKLSILSSGGITFNGDTAAANALDDYEEGTWTPTNASGQSVDTIANGSAWSISGGAKYTKIGEMVTVYIAHWQIPSTGGNYGFAIGGLPFTNMGSISVGTNTIVSNSTNAEKGLVVAGSNKIYLYPANTTTQTTNAGLSTKTLYGISATYKVA